MLSPGKGRCLSRARRWWQQHSTCRLESHSPPAVFAGHATAWEQLRAVLGSWGSNCLGITVIEDSCKRQSLFRNLESLGPETGSIMLDRLGTTGSLLMKFVSIHRKNDRNQWCRRETEGMLCLSHLSPTSLINNTSWWVGSKPWLRCFKNPLIKLQARCSVDILPHTCTISPLMRIGKPKLYLPHRHSGEALVAPVPTWSPEVTRGIRTGAGMEPTY